MVNYSGQQLDLVFGALADPTRRAILERLARGPVRVTDLAKPFKISLPAVSKHLKVLEKAGILIRTRKGREHELSADARAVASAHAWLEEYRRFWDSSFDSLDRYLEQTKPKNP